MKQSKIIGKEAVVKNRDSFYFGEWGTIIDFDGDYYYIAIANDMNSVPVFSRNEFTVRRKGE